MDKNTDQSVVIIFPFTLYLFIPCQQCHAKLIKQVTLYTLLRIKNILFLKKSTFHFQSSVKNNPGSFI